MIYFIGGAATIERYLSSHWGGPLVPRLQALSYENLFKRRTLPNGTYIFGEVDLLSNAAAERAAAVWAGLLDVPDNVVLNHPTSSMKRYELLRTLRVLGVNTFDVYRLTEARRPTRFPVFLRDANDHTGSLTTLLDTREALDLELARLCREGRSRDDKLIVEYCDTKDDHGVYRKYSAFIIGETVIPVPIAFSRQWVTKGSDAVLSDDLIREEWDYVTTNPHLPQLKEIFALAHISYGRVDYGVLNGMPQVWEINTNPHFDIPYRAAPPARLPACQHIAESINAAFRTLDPRRNVGRHRNPVRRQWVRERQKYIIHGLLRGLGLSRYEPAIFTSLVRYERTLRSGLLNAHAAITRLSRRTRPS